jgi:hypothetical protein
MDFATLLNPSPDRHRVSVEVSGHTAQAKLRIGPFDTDALILATASAFADYQGPIANAGITLRILVDLVDSSEADSFESQSSSIRFRASTAFNFLLEKNNIANVEARVDPMGSGGQRNNSTNALLQCFAIAVKT